MNIYNSDTNYCILWLILSWDNEIKCLTKHTDLCFKYVTASEYEIQYLGSSLEPLFKALEDVYSIYSYPITMNGGYEATLRHNATNGAYVHLFKWCGHLL